MTHPRLMIETGEFVDPAVVDQLFLISSRVGDDRWFQANPERRYFARYASRFERRLLYQSAVPADGIRIVVLHRDGEQIERRLASRFTPIKPPERLTESECSRLWHANRVTP
jgi:hypothetical protein